MRRAALFVAGAGVAAIAALACEDGAIFTSGATEPIRVRNGQFIKGDLPHDSGGPKILTIDSQNNSVVPGATGKHLAGSVEGTATAFALRLADAGNGFWTLPVGAADPQMPQVLTWDAFLDFARDIRPGEHDLQIVAVDADGHYGPINPLPLTFSSLLPAGKALITLRWDSDVDLDLHVVAPSGKEIDPKHGSTSVDGGVDPQNPPPPGVGVIDRDSNAGCVIDSYRQEDVVFADAPAPGRYLLRVDMFSACGLPATNFVVEVWLDGKVVFHQPGRLIDLDADGGGPGSGLYVGDVTF